MIYFNHFSTKKRKLTGEQLMKLMAMKYSDPLGLDQHRQQIFENIYN